MTFTITFLVLMLFFDNGNAICGRRIAVRSVDGDNAPEGQFPYVVSLRHTVSKEHICSGVIIDQEWVLVAGTCIKQDFIIGRDEYEVFVGSTTKYQNGDFYRVRKIYRHPDYNVHLAHYGNNLALLKVVPIKLSQKVATIGLGYASDGDGTIMTFSGWGQPIPYRILKNDALRIIVMNTVSSKKCQEMYNMVQHKVDGTTQICALDIHGRSPCIGDFGGPLVNTNTNRLVGIFSNVENCRGQYPAIFVRVSAYKRWIEVTTRLKFSLI